MYCQFLIEILKYKKNKTSPVRWLSWGKNSSSYSQASLQDILSGLEQRPLGFISEFLWLTQGCTLSHAASGNRVLRLLARARAPRSVLPGAQLWQWWFHRVQGATGNAGFPTRPRGQHLSSRPQYYTAEGSLTGGKREWGRRAGEAKTSRWLLRECAGDYADRQAFRWNALASTAPASLSHFLQLIPSSFQLAGSPREAATAEL